MMIYRWSAPQVPSVTQLSMLFATEGLDYEIETLKPQEKYLDHRHPHTEIRIISSGELTMVIAGNQVLLRPGDRIEIPANTKHSFYNNSPMDCTSIVARRMV